MVEDVRVPLSSRTGAALLAAHAVSAASRAAAALTGSASAQVDGDRIAIAYTSERWVRVSGQAQVAFSPLSAFFPTRDGWVRTHATYPHHAAALRRGLALPGDAERDAVARALRDRGAHDAARAVTAAGGLCVAVEAESRETDARLRQSDVVSVTRLGAAAPRPLPGGPRDAPLRGLRVLDLTRVIAGPVATRTLALLGADVLRIDGPRIPEIPWQHLDTGHGKRSAILDLAASAGRRAFAELLETADVVVLGYRPARLDLLGLSPAALAERRPGLIVARLTAWGEPDRRGFDSLVQAATGIAWLESEDGGAPGALPAQALDHSAGYLLAAEIMTLLARRAEVGGSWLAETSLRRVAAELLDLPRHVGPNEPPPLDPTGHVQDFDVDGVALTTAAPALAFPGGPMLFAAPRPGVGMPPCGRRRIVLPDPRSRPKERAEAAADLFGRALVVTWCEELLAGRAGDVDARWPDITWLGGTIGWPAYWRRVWGARGLLHLGPPERPELVVAALADPEWRVREMALKVMRAHDLADDEARVDALTEDPIARVRRQAWRTRGVAGPPE